MKKINENYDGKDKEANFVSFFEFFNENKNNIKKIFYIFVLPCILFFVVLKALDLFIELPYSYVKTSGIIIKFITLTVIFSVYGSYISIYKAIGKDNYTLKILKSFFLKNIKKIVLISIIYTILLTTTNGMLFLISMTVATIFLFLPFIMIHEGIGFSDAIKKNTAFIKSNKIKKNIANFIIPVVIAIFIYIIAIGFLSLIASFFYNIILILVHVFLINILFFILVVIIYISASLLYINNENIDTVYIDGTLKKIIENNRTKNKFRKKRNRKKKNIKRNIFSNKNKEKDRFNDNNDRNIFEEQDSDIKF